MPRHHKKTRRGLKRRHTGKLTPDQACKLVLKGSSGWFGRNTLEFKSFNPRKAGGTAQTVGSFGAIVDLGAEFYFNNFSYSDFDVQLGASIVAYGGGATAPWNAFTLSATLGRQFLIDRFTTRYTISNPSNVKLMFTAYELTWQTNSQSTWTQMWDDYLTNGSYFGPSPLVGGVAAGSSIKLIIHNQIPNFLKWNNKAVSSNMKITQKVQGSLMPNQTASFGSKLPKDFKFVYDRWVISGTALQFHKGVSRTWILEWHSDMLGGGGYDANGIGNAGCPLLPIAVESNKVIRFRPYAPIYQIPNNFETFAEINDDTLYADMREFDDDNVPGQAPTFV